METKYDNSNEKKIGKKNLLIGVVSHYGWNTIAPFIKSFHSSGFKNCDFILYVDELSRITIKKIKSYGIIIKKVPDYLKKKIVINYRWKIYEDFLINNQYKYKFVFTADLRDVFFQQDVFQFFENNDSFLGIALEDGMLTDKLNKYWIVSAYGEEKYNFIKNNRIICIGTVWGTPDKFYEFSKIMWEKLDSKWSLSKNVIEQAVTNYIIYYDKMFNDSIISSDNINGRIMTIGLTKYEDIKFDSENNILNKKGEKAAVIHQYDRKIEIVKLVQNKYCKPKKIKNIDVLLICVLVILILVFATKKVKNYLNKKKLKKLKIEKK
jgi:hypothetical protein